jgi:circadian clock protein KaiC
MNSKKNLATNPLKVRTGIAGFDEITKGGLPRAHTTLVEGGAGSGKTIFALQSLVNGARYYNEPGIFVAFEESPKRIRAHAQSFGWDLVTLEKQKLFFLDAQPTPDLIQSGGFDLSGMLAALEVKVREMKAKRIVFDALDIVLSILNDPLAVKREVYRLHQWLLEHELTALVTSKTDAAEGTTAGEPHLGFMQFMVDCAVTLNHTVNFGVSQRNLRVVKYRGSAFSENESPFLIGDDGVDVAGESETVQPQTSISRERVTSGVKRLDAMLGGGYYRNASVLITGVPGTAKSTLGGAFAEAACRRGEPTLYVSFDSKTDELVSNLVSVNIRLERFVKKGLLRMVWARSLTGSAEYHLMKIKRAAKEHHARCVVIDPVSALTKSGNENTATSVAERLLDWTKASDITLLCTSLLVGVGSQVESTPLQISTLSDTWIHLNYQVRAGERNRGLSIIKSRGTSHSNQVRELILSKAGVTLADVYAAGGEVLMGTLRWEKERAEQASRDEAKTLADQRQSRLATEKAAIEARLKAVQCELEAKCAEQKAQTHLATGYAEELTSRGKEMRALRGVD